MDRKQMANALMGYADITTADILNTPIARGGVLPLTEYADRTEFDPSSGLLGSIGRAVTAPARAYRGEMTDDQMIDEGANLAGWMTLGGYMAPKPTHVSNAGIRDTFMSAYKSMGPKDPPSWISQTPNSLLEPGRRIDAFSTPGMGNFEPFSKPTVNSYDELLRGLYSRGMGPANSNKATAELFANAKTAAIPGLPMTDGMRLLLADYLGYGNDEGPIY